MRSLHFQRLIGAGAFGSVYLADMVGERGFRRPVAVKVLLKEQAGGEQFMSRVRDEARLLGLLQDDHILKVLELAKVDGRDAVVMEFVEGVDLAAIIEMQLRPPPRALGELGAAVAGALHRAHTAVHPTTGEPLKVVHRDVKPANVMLTDRGNVKLLDFGVARARFESRESYTGQFVLGTLNYMAPEYIVTGEISPAADIYGLALTLWEAACGEVFGQPKLRKDLHEQRVEERLQVIQGTHAQLVPILRAMLAWEPKERPNGASVERQFIAATDMLRGTGLRSWAAEAIPKALAKERAAAKDDIGLVGKTVPMDEAEGSPASVPPPQPAPPIPDEATLHKTSRPAFLDDSNPRAPALPPPPPPPPGTQTRKPASPAATSTPGARAPASAALPSGRTSPGAKRTPPAKNGNMLLLQGLLIGGGLGVLIVLAIVVVVIIGTVT